MARRALKRAFDVVFSALVLVCTAPVVLAAAMAIRFDTPGPVLFRQPRLGQGGRIFTLVKLRGMYADAPERFPELYVYDASPHPDQFYFHLPHDPRVTRVGGFLRRWSIDELPNFWNVLRGDMSVVGPRPEIPQLAGLYGTALEQLLSVKPGVTSPAKATGRDELSFSETLASDLAYASHNSFLSDIIIVRTARSLLRRRDAR